MKKHVISLLLPLILLVSHLEPPGIERFRVIGLLHGLSADWDHRPTREEILELNDPNQPRPNPPELEGDPNLLREMIRQQAQPIMEEEVAALIGAASGVNNPERTTWRNGYRAYSASITMRHLGHEAQASLHRS